MREPRLWRDDRPLGNLADMAEIWTAIAVVPLLLQVLHVYSAMRALIG